MSIFDESNNYKLEKLNITITETNKLLVKILKKLEEKEEI